jgi:hypothetical protein
MQSLLHILTPPHLSRTPAHPPLNLDNNLIGRPRRRVIMQPCQTRRNRFQF